MSEFNYIFRDLLIISKKPVTVPVQYIESVDEFVPIQMGDSVVLSWRAF